MRKQNPSLPEAIVGTEVSSWLYDDAGDGQSYQDGEFMITEIVHTRGPSNVSVQVTPGTGYPSMPRQRQYHVVFRGASKEALPLAGPILCNGEALRQLPEGQQGAGWSVMVEAGGRGVVRLLIQLPAMASTRDVLIAASY